MTTTQVPHRPFCLFASQTLLLSIACVLLPTFAVANQDLAPAVPINMNEAPPPWGATPVAAEQQPAPAVRQAAPAASGVEDWYRNRRKTNANAGNELATLQAAASSGDAKAQYKLAMRFRSDDNPQADIKQSLDWQQKAAQSGHAEAQYGLGLLYANGQYVPQDNAQARTWFQHAADQGHVAARLALLSLGNGVPAQAVASSSKLHEMEPEPALPPQLTPKTSVVDPASRPEPVTTKVSMQTPTTDNGTDTGADNHTGASDKLDLSGIDPAVLRQSAEGGDKQAQLMLGTMYEDGLGGLPSDLREAAYWYEQAAQQNYPKAQYNLGLLYEDGRGVKQNDNQAAYWYDRAAKAGFTEAQNNLGVLYVLGKGVKKDSKRAEKLFTESASRGNADAQRNLDMLRKG